jgi:hypothetical protein
LDKRRSQDEVLLQLAKNRDLDFVRLPYSSVFESICDRLHPEASTEEKHELWERLLELRSGADLAESGHSAEEPAEWEPPDASASVSRYFPDVPVTPASPPVATPRSDHEYTGLLPYKELDLDDAQSWVVPRESRLSPELEERKQKILIALADSHLANCEQRVASVLRRFPETRDSDTALCIRYWKTFQADVIERWNPLELEVLFELDRIETLGRVRRMIQNDLRLFRGVEDTRRAREAMQSEFHEYIAAHRDSAPEIQFYLDETGNEGHKRYTGVAGICIINKRQFEKHQLALEQWRAQQGWPEPIHFADTGAEKMERAVSLLAQLQRRREGVLFVGYSLMSQGRTHEDLFSLLIQIVVDSLRHLDECKCLTESRRVRVIKEADSGFDGLFLDKMTKRLGEAVALEFPGKLAVLPVETKPKGRTVLLECADLIAGGMQRRAIGKGSNPKDRLAEAIVNVTGFEDRADQGMLFKYFAASH